MPLNGLVVPSVALFGDQGKLDLPKNSRFYRGLLDDGIRHILVLGVPGEAASLTPPEREQLLEKAVESMTFGSDIWAAVDGATTEEAVSAADVAEAGGASVLVAFPPRGARVEPSHVLERFRAIHAQSKLSLLAYHAKDHGGAALTPHAVRTLAGEGVLEGVLDASGDKTVLRSFLEGAPAGFAVFGGDGSASVELVGKGALGMAWETANVLPRLSSKIWDLCDKGDTAMAGPFVRLQEVLVEASRAAPRPASLKFLSRYLRETDDGYRPPHGALTDEQQAKVRAVVDPHKEALQEFA